MPTCFLVSWACDACAHNTNCAPCHKPTVTWLSSQKEKVYVMMQEPENVFFFSVDTSFFQLIHFMRTPLTQSWPVSLEIVQKM